MEYRSQTEWNEVYQGRYLNNQPELLQKRYKRDFKLSHFQFMQLLEMLKPFIQKNDTRWRGAIPAVKTLGWQSIDLLSVELSEEHDLILELVRLLLLSTPTRYVKY
jgi:hypothetical protein